jgi:hypothetical protein
MFVSSYDGRKGTETYGRILPEVLNLVNLVIEGGRSTQSTLLGRQDVTYESLYVSAALIERIESSHPAGAERQHIASAIRQRSGRGSPEVKWNFPAFQTSAPGTAHDPCPHSRRTVRKSADPPRAQF